MAQGSFKAGLTETAAQPLTVGRLVSLPDTPGNVGVALSGGGSRALSAGMGELRGLARLQLLGKTKALSTVSGGSWLGVTFEYLTSGTADGDFLGPYVEPGQLTPEGLEELPPGNIANAVDSDLFSIPALGVEAYLLYKHLKTPPDFLWQALMGLHILAPYGLYEPDPAGGMQPTSLFSWDAGTLQAQVTGPNPALAAVTAHLVAGGPDRIRRPFLICNTALFLNEPQTLIRFLAPVQATPVQAGIVGAPTGTDANGRTPGGGGVTPFAFSSNPTAVAGTDVTVSQQRQLSLTDIVGASSAAFADTLENQFAIWEQDPLQFIELLGELLKDVWDWLEGHLEGRADLSQARSFVASPPTGADFAEIAELKADLGSLKALIPQYQYWPVAGAAGEPQTNPTRFADAGSLENSGVNALLSYTDVDRILAFLNASTPMAAAPLGMFDAGGHEIPDTRVILTEDIPPLFGYQPYQSNQGYRLYAGARNPVFPQGKNSQVFEPSLLAEVIQGLWAANGAGQNLNATLYTQSLATLDNPWFGVRGGRRVTVLWVYPNRAAAWFDQLTPAVQALLAPFGDPRSLDGFPHYSTLDTDLTATQVNLLASLTSWMVADPANARAFQALFEES
jgi:hypothetical protein